MKRTVLLIAATLAAALLWLGQGAACAAEPQSYAAFTKGAQAQPGLLTVWRKRDGVYLEIAPGQLGQDFIETAVPVNGLGGFTIFPGYVYLAPARIMRFTRAGDKIVITWPNTIYDAKNPSAQAAAAATFAQSVVALADVVAVDASNGHVVFSAKPFLADVSGVSATLEQSLGAKNPLNAYHLDAERGYFGTTEAFPENVVIEAAQTFVSVQPKIIDNVPDPRSLQLKIDYNIARAPSAGAYRPRLADPRVGFWSITRLAYGDYSVRDNRERYILRWNLQPSDPGQPLSPAQHPLVYYLSNTIPPEYRRTVRDALLSWNAAFERIGISNAVEVRAQPSDPSWSPDDIRYNVVRWVTGSNVQFGAEAEVVFDPRTGEEINVGVLLDGNDLRFVNNVSSFEVEPLRAAPREREREASFGAQLRRQGAFALQALQAQGEDVGGVFARKFREQALRAIVLHESGHDFGLNHNFIGSEAYTAQELRSRAFTQANGITSSVMEYAPVNLWPKGTSTGTYFQEVLGPYDYHAIRYGYEPLPAAKTPADEVPELNLVARQWSDPRFRFAGDEDSDFAGGHAVDPRVNIEDLTNDPLSWCAAQLALTHGLLRNLDAREPRYGQPYEVARQAFGTLLGHERYCLELPEHYIGGAYLSRSHKGDPGAAAPFQPVPRALELRAFGMLERYLFSERAWTFSPRLLNTLTYSEWNNWTEGAWAYDPPARHDVPVAQIAASYQERVLAMLFDPLMLTRLDQITLNAASGTTMDLGDLFTWMQRSVYAELHARRLAPIGVVRRGLQQRYTHRLIELALEPPEGTPGDASALARMELSSLAADLHRVLRSRSPDTLTRAHLLDLAAAVHDALGARTVVPER
ncbi:DUF5117 domain-containing protein [bacterium]|nr:MAG: DUF5117 domain-containing protein [bacterium]